MATCQNPTCGSMIVGSGLKYCSRSCAAQVNGRLFPKRQKLIKPVVAKVPRTKRTKDEYNAYMRKYMTERYHRRRQEAIVQLGGVCVICGCTDKLEIDHIDRTEKTHNLGKIFSGGSDKKVAEEIVKCQLLCERHHMEKTVGQLKEIALSKKKLSR